MESREKIFLSGAYYELKPECLLPRTLMLK
ncbi:hypothetical protein SPV1_05884 [Mariprofundus ferrooxydans PV-1]|uniref:Uncharacterized protein n=1 Tax=Mariprofundus ferrooxydans PV-1 TaxID=314345 RepID=Q0EYC5_9PROT|nr:hypothetical protein SPV1_05884 [Mariprofundus ferrooxydans PV-1]